MEKIQVVDSKDIHLSLREIAKIPLILFICSLVLFVFAYFFCYILFKIFLVLNTVLMIIGFTYTILFGLIPLAFRNKPQVYEGSDLVSILIAVFNDGEILEKNLENLVKLTYPNYEILVIYSTKSTDRTEEVALHYASQYPNIQAIPESNSKSNALNMGIDRAQGEYIVILDSDTFIYDGFIERALAYFSNPNLQLVQGFIISRNSRQNLVTHLAWVFSVYFAFMQVGEVKYFHGFRFSGHGAIWRKRALVEAGKFALNTLTEDHELNLRLTAKFPHWKGVVDEQLFCYDFFPTKYTTFYLQQLRWVTGSIVYSLKGLRYIKTMNWGQKFLYSAGFLLGTVFPLISWSSMGMSVVQFFANFYYPNVSFGGGVFMFLLGVFTLIISFIIMFIFAYRTYYRNSMYKVSLTYILIGILGIMYLFGLVMAVVSMNSLKLIVQKKANERFVKVDKSDYIIS